MTTATKKQKRRDCGRETEQPRAARKQKAGDGTVETESSRASQKQGVGDKSAETEPLGADAKNKSGDRLVETGNHNAANTKADGDKTGDTEATSAVCSKIQSVARYRHRLLKTRVINDNILKAAVAQTQGYSSGLDEKQRAAMFTESAKVIKAVSKGGYCGNRNLQMLIVNALSHVKGYQETLDVWEEQMRGYAKQLPVAEWAESIRGFGLLRLAMIIGETGDLSNYANPGKVWRRLGLAPYQGKMPSTWRRGKEGKLTADEWSEVGYSPRRRSTMYVISDLLVKLNFDVSGDEKQPGEYRQRFDEAKERAAENHPDWSKMRVNYHGHLLMAKRLVRNLWVEWNKGGDPPNETDVRLAATN